MSLRFNIIKWIFIMTALSACTQQGRAPSATNSSQIILLSELSRPTRLIAEDYMNKQGRVSKNVTHPQIPVLDQHSFSQPQHALANLLLQGWNSIMTTQLRVAFNLDDQH